MRLLFLGTGSAFTVGGNYNSNMLVTADSGRRLLIDAGVDLRHALYAQGLSYLDFEDIYISHLHSDHIGGLEYVGLSSRFDPRCSKKRLFTHASLVGPLWNNSLRGGMEHVELGDSTLDDYFEVRPCTDGFDWEGMRFSLVAAPHVRDPERVTYSYGVMIEVGDERVYITTDTRFEPDVLTPHYEAATLIFHDCETSSFKTPVHAHFDGLCGLPDALKAKIWLYHYQPGALPDAVEAGFRGFVSPGQSFEIGAAAPARAVSSGC